MVLRCAPVQALGFRMRRSAFDIGFRELHGHFPGRTRPMTETYEVVQEQPVRRLTADQALIWLVVGSVALMAIVFLSAVLIAAGVFVWGALEALFV